VFGVGEPDEPRIDVASPANRSVLRFLDSENGSIATSSPDECDWLTLGTHPDLVEHLWKLPGLDLSVCGCVIGRRGPPLLVSPVSRIIFGLAKGTSTLALRLPEPALTSALGVERYGREYHYPSGPVRAAEIGDDWALVRPYGPSNVEWCRQALAHAEALG
jgi:hypothetical protein